ncbi:23S ribosomal RNA methyltransferase Erm [Agromyces sp. Marseille-P2726]|uniref:23S ribosomal RNA methyltransferase Erm n=1 Tax=Agromyces sp. Marseille-P2726 TaxID=2709132 RepID=UPI001570B387|nr:23S ribosomal RNA methyltransferase Erm [Agromyces sp. Marseille-P2726]
MRTSSSSPSSSPRSRASRVGRPVTGGRHEYGQNFLRDRRVAASIADVVSGWPRHPLIEFGPGDGAITEVIAARMPLTAVEIDRRYVERLRARHGRRVRVVHGDLLEFRMPRPSNLVSNVPFRLTTPLLRRLFADSSWQHALLVLQWEVARKRAGVGGATLMTAEWWPWYDSSLLRRIPARAFAPVPSVDAGLLHLERRTSPLVPVSESRAYRHLVRRVFAAPGRGAVAMAGSVGGRRIATAWARDAGVATNALVRSITAAQWAALHRISTARR